MYIDFITRIKNIQNSDRKILKIPYTKMDKIIADILSKKGFLKKVEVKGKSLNKIIKINLNPNHPIRGSEFLSKSSRRIYKGANEIRPVKSGHGILVISTSEGVMIGSEAKKKNIGGQILFKIW